ncbi:MAG: ABC transporter ATP-binding protein [Acidobacteriota bacterium]
MITVENLSFTYPKATERALRGLHFQIARGEIFGFLGPSGAGKSTTQKILIGLLKDYQGQVSVFGKDLKTWQSDYYERVGVSFELPNHYLKLTALENLRYFAALYGNATREPIRLLERVGLGSDGDKLVSQFSKGMKNRLNVARSLLHDPELLFLDEPTTGLDPVNARLIKELIEEQRSAGKTVFLTTHNMSVADELCDRVGFIVDGEVRLIDAPRELKLRYGSRVVRVEYQSAGQTATRDFPLEALGDDADFIALLRDGQVQTLHTLEATLEDIFIEATGRRLE